MPSATSDQKLYALHETRNVRLRIHYPTDLDKLVLRTDLDWEKDILPSSIDRDGLFAEFSFQTTHTVRIFEALSQAAVGTCVG